MGKTNAIIGYAAPEIELPTIPEGKTYKVPIGQKPIAVFFFPETGSIGCMLEACSFRDALVKNASYLKHPELEIVGISADPPNKLQKFADDHKLPYTLLSDFNGKARERYHVDRSLFGSMDGRETFFIGRDGIVKGSCRADIDMWAHTRFVASHLKEMDKEKDDLSSKVERLTLRDTNPISSPFQNTQTPRVEIIRKASVGASKPNTGMDTGMGIRSISDMENPGSMRGKRPTTS